MNLVNTRTLNLANKCDVTAPICRNQFLSLLRLNSFQEELKQEPAYHLYLHAIKHAFHAHLFVHSVSDTYLSPIHIVKDKVELLWGLEGVVEPDQKRVFQTLQQHISLCHDVLLLKREKRKISWKLWETDSSVWMASRLAHKHTVLAILYYLVSFHHPVKWEMCVWMLDVMCASFTECI